jgi:hypothetical protein
VALFNIFVGRGFALRFGLERRFSGLETNKARRVGFMFKCLLRAIIGAAKRLRQPPRERSREAGEIVTAKAEVDAVSIRRNNRPTMAFKYNNKQAGRLICADSMDGGRF